MTSLAKRLRQAAIMFVTTIKAAMILRRDVYYEPYRVQDQVIYGIGRGNIKSQSGNVVLGQLLWRLFETNRTVANTLVSAYMSTKSRHGNKGLSNVTRFDWSNTANMVNLVYNPTPKVVDNPQLYPGLQHILPV